MDFLKMPQGFHSQLPNQIHRNFNIFQPAETRIIFAEHLLLNCLRRLMSPRFKFIDIFPSKEIGKFLVGLRLFNQQNNKINKISKMKINKK